MGTLFHSPFHCIDFLLTYLTTRNLVC